MTNDNDNLSQSLSPGNAALRGDESSRDREQQGAGGSASGASTGGGNETPGSAGQSRALRSTSSEARR